MLRFQSSWKSCMNTATHPGKLVYGQPELCLLLPFPGTVTLKGLMPSLPVASTSSLPGSLPHSDIENKNQIGFQMLSSSFVILCLPFTRSLETCECALALQDPGHLDTMQVMEGEACSSHTRQAALLPFHFPFPSSPAEFGQG